MFENILRGKVVILGIGNTLRSDDGLGPELITKLKGKVSAELIDCGETPENFTGKISALKPDAIVLVDAVNMGLSAGGVKLISPDQIAEFTFSTHNSSLQYFVNFISAETRARVYIVGVQPQSMDLKEGLSEEVSAAIQKLASKLVKILPKNPSTVRPACLPARQGRAGKLTARGKGDDSNARKSYCFTVIRDND